MDIRCRKTNCRYNDRLTCRAGQLQITKKLCCDNYCFCKDKAVDISKKIFESNTPPQIAPYRHNKDLVLSCEALCLFNRNGKCIANGITVGDCQKLAKCITFAKP